MSDLSNNPMYDSGSNGKEAAENVGRTAKNIAKTVTKPIAKGAKKKAKEYGRKAANQIAKHLLSALKAIAGVVSSHGPAIIAVILVIVIIYGSIAVLVSSQLDSSNSEVSLTPEGQVIIRMFESYCNETYRSGHDGDDNDRLTGVSRDSNRRTSKLIDNTDSERTQYSRVLSYIKSNNYEFILCALWKVFAREMYAECLYKDNSLQSQENFHNDYGWNSSEDAYKMFIQFYYTEELGTENARIGFESSLKPDKYKGVFFHQFYVNELFKACLEAFVQENGSYVKNIDGITAELKDEASNKNKDDNKKETIATESIDLLNNKKSKFDSTLNISDYSKKITNKTFENFKRGLSERAGFVNSSNAGENSDLKIPYISYVYKYYYLVDGKIPDNTKLNDEIKEECLKDLKSKISNTATSFIIFAGTGSTANLVRLAKAQINNGGQKYCDELFNGMLVDWCAIYAGWLLKNGGDIHIEEYAWSAAVPTWANGLKNLGKFRDSSYHPKVGDIVFFGGFAHVGIVIEVNDTGIVSSEGNTAGGASGSDFCRRSKVSEYSYSFSDPYICGYGMVTYRLDVNNFNTVGSREGALMSVMGNNATNDPNYKCVKYTDWSGGKKLTSSERRILEETVSGEFGNDYNGAVMIAQCLRDALVYEQCDNVSNLPSKMQYDGYYAWGGREPTSIAKDAVAYVFDDGGMGVQHRIFVMYNPTICSSSWHESLNYIVTVGDVRFFDYW